MSAVNQNMPEINIVPSFACHHLISWTVQKCPAYSGAAVEQEIFTVTTQTHTLNESP